MYMHMYVILFIVQCFNGVLCFPVIVWWQLRAIAKLKSALNWPTQYLLHHCFHCVAAQLQKNSGDTCPCETPCNLTRYGKELSMVKIPSKGSARYLSRKYDKSEDYIRCESEPSTWLNSLRCSDVGLNKKDHKLWPPISDHEQTTININKNQFLFMEASIYIFI